MFLNRFSLRTRLFTGFGLLVAAAVALSALGAGALYSFGSQFSGKVQYAAQADKLANKVADAASQRAVAVRNMALARDAQLRAEQRQKVVQSHEALGAGIQELTRHFESKPADSPEKTLLQRLKAVEDEYSQVALAIVALLDEDKTAEATHKMLTECLPLLARLQGVIAELNSLETGALDGSLKAAVEQNHAAAQRQIAVTVGAGLLAVVLAVLITRSILQPLARAVAVAETVAKGDLTSRIEVSGQDELSRLLLALQEMNRSLHSTLGSVVRGSAQIQGATTQIAQGNQELAERTALQTQNLQEMRQSTGVLENAARTTAGLCGEAQGRAAEVAAQAKSAGGLVGTAVESVNQAGARAQSIQELVSMVERLAQQSNLLSLNAAVEAARAGEAGKGFSVVAQEVRRLASSTGQAARDIRMTAEEVGSTLSKASELSRKAEQQVTQLVSGVQSVSDELHGIEEAARASLQSVHQTQVVVRTMEELTEKNDALVEEVAQAAQSTQHQAKDLAASAARFKV